MLRRLILLSFLVVVATPTIVAPAGDVVPDWCVGSIDANCWHERDVMYPFEHDTIHCVAFSAHAPGGHREAGTDDCGV